MRPLFYQTLRFASVGLVNTLVGLSCIYLIIFLFHTGAGVANAIGYAIGLAVSFFLNRFWTFRSTQRIASVLPRYLMVAAISYLLNLAAVLVGNRQLGIGPYAVQLLGMAVYTPTMFLGCRFLVFNRPAPHQSNKPS